MPDAAYHLLAEIEQLLMQNDFAGAKNALNRGLEGSYREGYTDGVSNYAIWKDGEQLVGCMQRPLKQVLAEFAKEKIPLRY